MKLSVDTGVAGINDRGQVAGNRANGTAYVYDTNTQTSHGLGFSAGTTDVAFAISQNGDVVGRFTTPGHTHTFVYHSSTGTYQDINPVLGSNDYSEARAISNSGLNHRRIRH